MAANSKPKRFLYKRATFQLPMSKTLEQLVRQAIGIANTALERRFQPIESEREFLLLNYNLSHGDQSVSGNIFGIEVLRYEEGAMPGACVLDEKAKELPLEQILSDKDKRQAIDSLLYAGIRGNHVILLQSTRLRSKDLDDYLNWLLKTKTRVIDQDNQVFLADPDPSQRPDRGKKNTKIDATELVISAPVSFTPVVNTSGQLDQKITTVQARGKLWKVVKTALKSYLSVKDQMGVKDLERSQLLDVELRLKWLNPGSSPVPNLLSEASRAFSHVDDEIDYTVKGKGFEYSKKDFKVLQPVSIQWGKVRPRVDDLFPKMLKYLHSLGETGRIKM